MLSTYLRSAFQRCACCRANTFSPDLLCKDCHQALVILDPITVRLPGLYGVALGDYNSPIIYTLINSLKGGGAPPLTLRKIAELMAFRLNCQRLTFHKNTLIVPAPSRILNEIDHAWELAHALSQTLDLPMVPLLARESDKEQKSLKREERLQIRMRKVKTLPSHQNILFVDDLITTGSTAQAARRALGSKAPIITLTLGYQPRFRERQ